MVGAEMASGVRGPTGNDRGSIEHKCRECKSANTMEDHHSGDIVCMDCGLVIGKVIDQGEEWRSFADDDGPDKSRVGAARNDLLSESAMSTSIARQQKDGPGGGYSTMSSLQGVASAQDRHLLDQFRKLQRMADRIKILGENGTILQSGDLQEDVPVEEAARAQDRGSARRCDVHRVQAAR